MKKRFLISLLAAFILFFLPMLTLKPEAARLWNKEVYHICDLSEAFTEEEYTEEAGLIHKLIPELEFDTASFYVPEDVYSSYGFDEYLDRIYDANEMGYGSDKDGIVLGIDTTNELFLLHTFGRGRAIFTEEKIRELSEKIREGYRSGSWLGAQQAYREAVEKIVTESGIKRGSSSSWPRKYKMVPAGLTTDEVIHARNDKDLPDWFYEDADVFKAYHNRPEDSRLIDTADIFTDEEEAEIQERLDRIREKAQLDIAVYTDETSYGLDNREFAEDFYKYKGYGTGDTYDGICLFVDMDPDNLQVVFPAFGKAEALCTENSESLEDVLYEDFLKERYGQGVIHWLDAVEKLFVGEEADALEQPGQKPDGSGSAQANASEGKGSGGDYTMAIAFIPVVIIIVLTAAVVLFRRKKK